ncbi:Mobile element protein [Cystobacter fuscus]|uniref:Mobile element protein n=1 Tax=Cystobacter fuscus TaxID=43 RepID=A0A250JCK7_9BACT|nr:Mobile element protein [Cystobacter fuscus]
MALDAMVERFTQRGPITLMVRRTLEHALSSQWIDEVFEAHREQQYARELLFSTVVDWMGLVALYDNVPAQKMSALGGGGAVWEAMED